MISGVILGCSRSDFFVVFWCLKLEVPPDRPKDPFLKHRALFLSRKCIKVGTRKYIYVFFVQNRIPNIAWTRGENLRWVPPGCLLGAS